MSRRDPTRRRIPLLFQLTVDQLRTDDKRRPSETLRFAAFSLQEEIQLLGVLLRLLRLRERRRSIVPVGPRDKHDPVGHLSDDGRVHVFNSGIIERLVRAGLRARV
jgi:hypothetical protein